MEQKRTPTTSQAKPFLDSFKECGGEGKSTTDSVFSPYAAWTQPRITET